MYFSLINFEKLRIAVKYAIVLLVCFFLQNQVLSHVSFFGVHPMFIPAFVVAVGMFSGSVWGGVFGIVSGIFCDIGFAENLVLFTISLPIVGFVSGLLVDWFFNRRMFSYMFICAAALLVCAFLQGFDFLFFSDSSLTALKIALLQVMFSLPFAALIYLPCKKISAASRGMQ